ncbi:SDR family oxidoreductase [Flavobacterium sp. JP2137]|uniref:SDR family oxidoreductase n=1 Tax=Flavobacterium sp. JP2137 TaxID=3414510 RepID=UPI003D2FC8E1
MILVTGGTGMLGAHLLLDLLRKEEVVRAIYRTEAPIEKTRKLFADRDCMDLFQKIEWVAADLNDIPALERAFEQVTRVYHCAAYVTFDPKEEEVLRKTNIEGTANLVNLAIAYKVDKFCHVSSIAALGETIDKDKRIDEKSNWNPDGFHSDYAISKYGSEIEVWRASQEALPIIIVNPGLIFGTGFWNQSSGELLNKIHQGMPFYTKGSVGVVAVEDVCSIMIQLMDSSIKNQNYVLVSENIGFQDLLNELADSLHKKRPNLYASPFSTGIAWRLDYLISLLTTKKRSFSRATAKASHATVLYDNSKITQTLNYAFIPASDFLKPLCQAYLQSL